MKNIALTHRSIILILTVPFLFSACISNKKHQAAVDLMQSQHQTEVSLLQQEVDTAQAQIRRLELNVAERIGENNILVIYWP